MKSCLFGCLCYLLVAYFGHAEKHLEQLVNLCYQIEAYGMHPVVGNVMHTRTAHTNNEPME